MKTTLLLSFFAASLYLAGPVHAEAITGEFRSIDIDGNSGNFDAYNRPGMQSQPVDLSYLVYYRGIDRLENLRPGQPVTLDVQNLNDSTWMVESISVNETPAEIETKPLRERDEYSYYGYERRGSFFPRDPTMHDSSNRKYRNQNDLYEELAKANGYVDVDTDASHVTTTRTIERHTTVRTVEDPIRI